MILTLLKQKHQNDVTNKKLGALYGLVCGDMIGVPVEFTSREERKNDPVKGPRAYGTHKQPKGTWSDDTSLTLALIDAIDQEFTLDKFANNIVLYYRVGKYTPHGRVFDIGNTTLKAIRNIEKGMPLHECGGYRQDDNGNGSLMRILPAGLLWLNKSDKEMITFIKDVSGLTHRHPRSILACLFYSCLIKELICCDDKKAALDNTIVCINRIWDKKYEIEKEYYSRIFNKTILITEEDNIKSSGYVVDSLEASIWSFMTTNSVKEAILKAVNLGGDTDTIGALTGGLAGSFYGIKNIPKNWLSILACKKMLDKMFLSFIK